MSYNVKIHVIVCYYYYYSYYAIYLSTQRVLLKLCNLVLRPKSVSAAAITE